MKRLFIGIILASIVLASGLYYGLLPETKHDFLNALAVYGTILSFGALLITYLQVRQTASVAEETKRAVEKTQQSIENRSLFQKAEANLKTIQQIEGYIQNRKFDIAAYLLKELIQDLHDLSQNSKCSANQIKYEINPTIKTFGIYNRIYIEEGVFISDDQPDMKKLLESLELATKIFSNLRTKIYQTENVARTS